MKPQCQAHATRTHSSGSFQGFVYFQEDLKPRIPRWLKKQKDFPFIGVSPPQLSFHFGRKYYLYNFKIHAFLTRKLEKPCQGLGGQTRGLLDARKSVEKISFYPRLKFYRGKAAVFHWKIQDIYPHLGISPVPNSKAKRVRARYYFGAFPCLCARFTIVTLDRERGEFYLFISASWAWKDNSQRSSPHGVRMKKHLDLFPPFSSTSLYSCCINSSIHWKRNTFILYIHSCCPDAGARYNFYTLSWMVARSASILEEGKFLGFVVLLLTISWFSSSIDHFVRQDVQAEGDRALEMPGNVKSGLPGSPNFAEWLRKSGIRKIALGNKLGRY